MGQVYGRKKKQQKSSSDDFDNIAWNKYKYARTLIASNHFS